MDIKIVDYQYSRFTTPVVDLSYFIGCSTVKETRVHLPELLQIYYDSLMEEIRLLGGISAPNELYPYEVFQSHCQKFMIFGFGESFQCFFSTSSLLIIAILSILFIPQVWPV